MFFCKEIFMPIYRYHCLKCNSEQELLLPRFDSPAVCPQCGSAEMKKLPSRFAAVTRSASAGCSMQDSCPSAGGHCCGGNCACHGH